VDWDEYKMMTYCVINILNGWDGLLVLNMVDSRIYPTTYCVGTMHRLNSGAGKLSSWSLLTL
jgi:hypothetical protein